MTEYTCSCRHCVGQTLIMPEPFTEMPKTVRTMVHNYIAMTHNPVMGPVLAARGITTRED